MLDGGLELFYVFSSPFAEGCLGLSVPLFTFFGRGIDLNNGHLARREQHGVVCVVSNGQISID